MERGVAVARKDGEITGADEDAYHEKLRDDERSRKMARPRQLEPVKKKPKIVNFR